jgi:protein-S-isoprenylcysteine O-methyltransferase Ste14
MADGETEPAVGDTSADLDTRELTREELRTTFEYQVQRLREIDGKAIEILKANLLLIGLVVTGGSILVQTDFGIGPFLNPLTVFGSVLLLVSTGLAAVTYTASNLRGGLDAAAVETALERGRGADTGGGNGDEPFEDRLLRSYAQWIEYNARVTAVNDILVTITVLLVFVSFVYVAVGIPAGAAGSRVVVWAAFGATTLAVAAFVWVVYYMDHIGARETPPGTFDGVRLSKGATRDTGMADLLAMLGRRPSDDEEE